MRLLYSENIGLGLNVIFAEPEIHSVKAEGSICECDSLRVNSNTHLELNTAYHVTNNRFDQLFYAGTDLYILPVFCSLHCAFPPCSLHSETLVSVLHCISLSFTVVRAVPAEKTARSYRHRSLLYQLSLVCWIKIHSFIHSLTRPFFEYGRLTNQGLAHESWRNLEVAIQWSRVTYNWKNFFRTTFKQGRIQRTAPRW